MGDGAEKVCRICGESCANQPRIKDNQGRYAHKACFERKMGERQTTGRTLAAETEPVGAGGGLGMPEDDAWVLPPEPEPAAPFAAVASASAGGMAASGIAAAGLASGSCPGCGYPVTPGAVLCTRCGHNLRSGKGIKTKVSREREPSAAVEALAGAGGAAAGMIPTPVRALIGAVILGAVGAGIWAAIVYNVGYEIRLMALAVGALVGVGAAWGAKGDVDAVTGGIAAVIALGSILAGKYVGTSMVADDMIAEIQQAVREENANLTPEERLLMAKMWVADDIVEERLDRAHQLTEQQEDHYNYLLEAGEYPEDYPKDIIEEAELRWSRMSQTDRELTERRAVDAEMTDADRDDIRSQAFESSFEGTVAYRRMKMDSPFAGFVLLGFGVVAAFVIGSNDNTYPFAN